MACRSVPCYMARGSFILIHCTIGLGDGPGLSAELGYIVPQLAISALPELVQVCWVSLSLAPCTARKGRNSFQLYCL